MARPNTPDRINPDGSKTIKMKRACNGCGTLLGDVTEQEMAAGINGRPLPDVRRECPTCAPTAPDPKCLPTTVLVGDMLCLDVECDHEHSAEGGADGIEDSYCDEVREETVCATHSRFVAAEDGFEELVHAEPWPCKRQEAAA
ncbi:hypothetical protein [Streptomyces sp. STCH 565 A]|uniref:hypothetical protein n=1 Tax=Streptomyces sp. STCH 565 A TaxID=2950532 RepID=UPI002075E624|nr:hypothetical protein [Streptomyces sp. STCH 565 A]MCM8555672.1 hypothetical protein [Streptomyces sp. STCH 565 A]